MTRLLGIAFYPLRRNAQSLLQGDEFEALQEDVDYPLPGVVARRPLGGDPQVAGGVRMRREVVDVGDDLGRILGLDDDRVLERFGVFLTGRADEGDAAGGHRFQADEAERLVPAVRQGGGRRSVQHREKVIRKEGGDVPNVSVSMVPQRLRQPGDIFDAVGQWRHAESALLRKIQDLTAEGFETTAHQQAGCYPTFFQLDDGGDRLVPALVRAEAPDLEEKRRRI